MKKNKNKLAYILCVLALTVPGPLYINTNTFLDKIINTHHTDRWTYQRGTLHHDRSIVVSPFKSAEIVIPVRTLTGSSSEVPLTFHSPDVGVFVTPPFFPSLFSVCL